MFIYSLINKINMNINMKNRILYRILFVLFLILVNACSNNKEEITPKPISQWAISAIASDSYGGLGENQDDQSAFSATGKPEINKCEDSKYAWTISKENDGLHWIELTYNIPVYVNKVRVYENFNPGSVVKIELKKEDNYETMWEGTYKTKQCPYVFEKEYSLTEGNITRNISSFKTDTIKITINTDIPGWNEIDAVELIGYEKKFTNINGTIILED